MGLNGTRVGSLRVSGASGVRVGAVGHAGTRRYPRSTGKGYLDGPKAKAGNASKVAGFQQVLV